MKNILFFLILIFSISCNKKAERDDKKFLGKHFGYLHKDTGCQDVVDIIPNESEEYPYIVTAYGCIASNGYRSVKVSRKCKIIDGDLVADDLDFTFTFNDPVYKFRMAGHSKHHSVFGEKK